MTMDVRKQVSDVMLNNNEEVTEVSATKLPVKRSFDVAFLMLPDDKLKQKQMRNARQSASGGGLLFGHALDGVTGGGCGGGGNGGGVVAAAAADDEDEDRRSEDDSPVEVQKQKYITLKHPQQVFGDPTIQLDDALLRKLPDTTSSPSPIHLHQTPQKSAFTKVSAAQNQRQSPNLSISPDLSYQNSLSPSPPILRHQYQNFPSPKMHFAPANHPYPNTFLQDHQGASLMVENAFLLKTAAAQDAQNFVPKMRPVLQYPPAPYQAYQGFAQQQQDLLKMGAGDARTLFSSLLPPSLAALSLPAQNICAKCNVSFRMTSDLVYHMRSHHKNDVTNDHNKRRREEKLKCPVCAESFRERHHLTRHMTAHQDKEGDALDGVEDGAHRHKAKASASSSSSSTFVFGAK